MGDRWSRLAASRSAKSHSSPSSPAPAPALPGAFAPGTARGTGSGRSGTATPAPGSPPELVDGGQCPEEGLLGHLLRRVGVPAEGQDVAVHVGEIRLIDLLKIRHGLTSLSAIGRMDSSFVTKSAGIPGSFLWLFSAAFLYGKHRSTNVAIHDFYSHPGSTWMIGSPVPITLRRRRGTQTPLHIVGSTGPAPTAPATTAATPRGHRSVPGRDHPAEQEHAPDHEARPLLPSAHAPISLFFLWRHYIMEASDLQGGR